MKEWDSRYDAILYREHPVSPNHPSMPLRERAAQFAAFKALTGFEEEIEEAGRYTASAVELDESRKEVLDHRLQYLCEHPETEAEIIWFEPDEKKEGGRYRRSTGAVRRIELLDGMIQLQSGEKIPLSHLYDVQGEEFSEP